MTFRNQLLLAVSLITTFGCNVVKKNADLKNLNAAANEESLTMVGYQPIDPIQVTIKHETDNKRRSDTINREEMLALFPNEATRLAIGEIGQNGTISFGPFSIARAGKSYSIILDYIKYTTASMPARYGENEQVGVLSGDTSIIKLKQELLTNYGVVNGVKIRKVKTAALGPLHDREVSNRIKVPVYMGVGLRIQASITVLSDSINLSSFYSLGLAASQKKLNGTMIIQTLGISGENISPLMPMPDQINESTIQSAMQALATIKSKIYDAKGVIISPQVIGFKLSFPIDGAKDLLEATLQSAPPALGVTATGKMMVLEMPELQQ
ncbi:hypothetical protein [Chitinophaga solisilvae]|uniref:hypothetical protein n=1 Tax=Chitinophaga solisilvae TaxID=1233460 RepID=UPI001371A201|nr:hypothetical protein [Chitinophaga solisilvae]